MSKVILDDALREELTQNGGLVELCDRDGQTVMYALSPEEYRRLVYAWAKAEFAKDDVENPVDDADDAGSMSTAELLAHLESLKEQGSGAA
jgi:DNA-binding transcriptional ArsR family regulator